ncbi:MAG: hypothetical protein Q8P53_03715 [Candidatus Shapirobacteria bacterium]|nr:hypothetical protein [Candidatus Shapirobacteria bacterium]
MKFKILKTTVLLFLVLLLTVNIYFSIFKHDPILEAKKMMISLSAGDRYSGRLKLWYLLANKGDWGNAAKLESNLDSVDIANYKSLYQPEELKKRMDTLIQKPNKSVEDWMELAKLQLKFNQTEAADLSISQAHKLDPIREDIEKLYLSSFSAASFAASSSSVF